jgi:hypothetical protein
MMAQLTAGAQSSERLAATARYRLTRWNNELETVIRRLLNGSALTGLVDSTGLTRARLARPRTL